IKDKDETGEVHSNDGVRSIDNKEATNHDSPNAGDQEEDIDPEEFLLRNPELADELTELFIEIDNSTTKESESKKQKSAEEEKILGDFRIIREIGRGGMATVYEAEQISLRRKVALKVLPSHLRFSSDAVKKFQREAEAGGRQSHQGIVAVHAVGVCGGVHYIAQELVGTGLTLANKLDELRRKKEIPFGYFRDVAELIADVADALDRAHASGVIHRDMKPSNILITGDGHPKVTDFGLAKIEDALALSRTGDFSGTPYYMSPEQAMSRRIGIDFRTDIYSLGVTLYEMITLKRPFEGHTSHEVLKKILLTEPEDPCKLSPRVPRDLVTICYKAMEKDPNHRYQSMRYFRDDLNRFISGEVIMAKPAGMATRIWKRFKRNPALSLAIGSSFFILFVSMLYVFWSYPHLLFEKEEAILANELLAEILSSADPNVEGRMVRVTEVYDRVIEKLETEFTSPTEVAASLRARIGKALYGLGHYSRAEPQLRKALEIRRNVLGPAKMETLKSMADLALLLKMNGQYTEAEALYDEAIAVCETNRSLENEHRLILSCKGQLAGLLNIKGNLAEAEELYRQVLKDQSRSLGKEDPDSLTSMAGLVKVLLDRGKYSESEKLCHDVLESRRRILGPEHPQTLDSMNDLAAVFEKQGKDWKAEKLYREVLLLQSKVLGEAHPGLLA
ncbi:MAG: serine/threonine-protein kinase, partial [Planctomycetota bacterium]